MLIKLKVKSWLAICHCNLLRLGGKQVPHILLYKKEASEDSNDLVDVSFKFHFMFDNSDETIGCYCRIDLYPDSGFGVSPESCHSQVLLYPFEEQLDLPTILVKEYYLLCRKEEVVCVEGKCPVEFGNESHYTSNCTGIIGSVPFPTESDCLVTENIGAVINSILSGFHHVCRMVFLPDYKERIHLLNVIEPSQIPIASIKNISGQRLIINHIKCVDIMDCGFGDIEHSGYLRDYIQLCMELYARLGASELRPFIDAHAQINCAGIKGIELATDAKFSVKACLLRLFNHMVGELLKHMPIPVSIASGEDVAVNGIFAKSEMERFLGMSRCDIGQLTKATAPEKLAEHENQQLSPVGQLPFGGAVFDSVFNSALHDSFKFSLWQKVGDLAENISSCMHRNSYRGLPPNIVISKVRQGISDLKIA